jgi:hypothetical protein
VVSREKLGKYSAEMSSGDEGEFPHCLVIPKDQQLNQQAPMTLAGNGACLGLISRSPSLSQKYSAQLQHSR